MGRPRGALSCERRPPHAPHIVVLMLDDLGFADTGFGGSPVIRTPAIDALASRAVHLTAFRAPTWCAPSRRNLIAAGTRAHATGTLVRTCRLMDTSSLSLHFVFDSDCSHIWSCAHNGPGVVRRGRG